MVEVSKKSPLFDRARSFEQVDHLQHKFSKQSPKQKVQTVNKATEKAGEDKIGKLEAVKEQAKEKSVQESMSHEDQSKVQMEPSTYEETSRDKPLEREKVAEETYQKENIHPNSEVKATEKVKHSHTLPSRRASFPGYDRYMKSSIVPLLFTNEHAHMEKGTYDYKEDVRDVEYHWRNKREHLRTFPQRKRFETGATSQEDLEFFKHNPVLATLIVESKMRHHKCDPVEAEVDDQAS
jgi:hypothetical protein